MKHICFIASGYPSEKNAVNAFVETLVNAIVDSGVKCTVIAPQSLTKVVLGREKLLPNRRIRKTPAGNSVTVLTPKFFSASAMQIGPVNTAEITFLNEKRSVTKAFRKLLKSECFDAIYGHFIYTAGLIANSLGTTYGIPAFFAYGENTTYTIDRLGEEKTRRLLQGVAGVISVSSENKKILTEKKMVPFNRIGVFPNAVDTGCFYPRNQKQARKVLGFPENAFIVAFVGRFVDVKGPDRLSAAIERLNDEGIFSIFIGDGPIRPSCHNILFCGKLQHDEIPVYLSAADVFVLPTKAEGCCNAIVEAMACGLPVISSNLSFNDDILDSNYSIRLDPNDVDALADAIQQMKDNLVMRIEFGNAALHAAQNMSINDRAHRVLHFMEDSCRHHSVPGSV